jgi:DNA-binding FrmR family transcriptional regulator
MTHTVQEKQKLLNRIRRLRGQIDSIERALDRMPAAPTSCGF